MNLLPPRPTGTSSFHPEAAGRAPASSRAHCSLAIRSDSESRALLGPGPPGGAQRSYAGPSAGWCQPTGCGPGRLGACAGCDPNAAWRLVETAEPALACPDGGAVVEVTSLGPPGVGVRTGAPRRAYRMGARARYAGAGFESGGYDSPPVLTPEGPMPRAGFPRGRNGGPLLGANTCQGDDWVSRGPAPPGAIWRGAPPCTLTHELDPRPAPTPLNMAVSISETRPTYQGHAARASGLRLARRTFYVVSLPALPGNRIRGLAQARAAASQGMGRDPPLGSGPRGGCPGYRVPILFDGDDLRLGQGVP